MVIAAIRSLSYLRPPVKVHSDRWHLYRRIEPFVWGRSRQGIHGQLPLWYSAPGRRAPLECPLAPRNRRKVGLYPSRRRRGRARVHDEVLTLMKVFEDLATEHEVSAVDPNVHIGDGDESIAPGSPLRVTT